MVDDLLTLFHDVYIEASIVTPAMMKEMVRITNAFLDQVKVDSVEGEYRVVVAMSRIASLMSSLKGHMRSDASLFEGWFIQLRAVLRFVQNCF